MNIICVFGSRLAKPDFPDTPVSGSLYKEYKESLQRSAPFNPGLLATVGAQPPVESIYRGSLLSVVVAEHGSVTQVFIGHSISK